MSPTDERQPHADAALLRWIYGGVSLFFLLGAVVVGFAAHDFDAALFEGAVLSLGLVLGTLYCDYAGMIPSGRGLSRRMRLTLAGMTGLASLAGLALLLSSPNPPLALSIVAAGLPFLAGGLALRTLLRG